MKSARIVAAGLVVVKPEVTLRTADENRIANQECRLGSGVSHPAVPRPTMATLKRYNKPSSYARHRAESRLERFFQLMPLVRFFQQSVPLIALVSLIGCGGNPAASGQSPAAPSSAPTAAAGGLPAVTPVYTFKVVKVYPHDTTAFTEGLFLDGGVLYESTGVNGQSTLRREDLETGKIQKEIGLSDTYFGEGITKWDGKIYQLTWKNGLGFVYDANTFDKVGQVTYGGEGWSLTHDDKSILMDNGSDAIQFRDPGSFAVQRTIHVSDHGTPVTQLNELEYIKGEIFANVWMTNYIVRIDPKSGSVLGWIDLTGLEAPDGSNDDVLNGIAYDAPNDRILVTGKRWAHIYQITVEPKQ
jgi:glutamine cyclotransferase